MKLDPKFTAVLQEIETTRGVPRDRILEALREGVQAAYEKNYGPTSNLFVEISLQRGLIEAFLEKTVVEDVADPNLDIGFEEAKQIEPEAEMGDSILIDADISTLGNLAIHTFKQHVKTLIRDAEREKIVSLYGNRLYELINCTVLYHEHGDIYVETPDKIEGIIPYKEQIPREKPAPGQRLKCLLIEVRSSRKAPMLIFSRTHNDLLRELMRNEIPEVREGNIEIVAISRDPGYRAKVAVRSRLPELDPVGSCIGSRGIRITAISHDLNDEKIDLVLYKEDPFEFIAEALSPAKVLSVEIFEELRRAVVVVPDDQISLAIGKGWRNVKLASKLTRYNLDVKSISEMEAEQGGGRKAAEMEDLPTEMDFLGEEAREQAAAEDAAAVEDAADAPGEAPDGDAAHDAVEDTAVDEAPAEAGDESTEEDAQSS